MQELIDEATRSQRPPVGHGRNSPDGHLTDSLGFYLTPDMETRSGLDLLGTAAQYKKKSDEILLQQSQVNAVFSVVVRLSTVKTGKPKYCSILLNTLCFVLPHQTRTYLFR